MHRLLVAALCTASFVPASAAAGPTEQVSTVVSFELARGDATWKGRVTSDASACERHRRVALKELQPGPDVAVAVVRADAHGRYWAHADVEYTTYYAKVRLEERERNGILCKGDRSTTITIAQADPV